MFNITQLLEEQSSFLGCVGGPALTVDGGASGSSRIDGGASGSSRIDALAPGAEIAKDNVIATLIPATVSECALHLKESTCMGTVNAVKVGAVLGIVGSPEEIVAQAQTKLGCVGEQCVLKKLAGSVAEAEHILQTNFKLSGPTDNKLLNNYNIDHTLRTWMTAFPGFYAYNFNMKDYEKRSWREGVVESPDTLAVIPFEMLYAGKVPGEQPGRKFYRCACVINTDIYEGKGKHWMALYAEYRPASASPPRMTVEFFNSSGNSPTCEWVRWLVRTRDSMEKIRTDEHRSGTVEIIKNSQWRHQKSQSECGVYSLFYIWARLNGVPPEYFLQRPVPDHMMFEFRQHLFADPTQPTRKTFDWGKYRKEVGVKWDP